MKPHDEADLKFFVIFSRLFVLATSASCAWGCCVTFANEKWIAFGIFLLGIAINVTHWRTITWHLAMRDKLLLDRIGGGE